MVPKLATLTHGEQFVYEFDFADSLTHLCTAAPTRIDPATKLRNHSERSAAALGVGNRWVRYRLSRRGFRQAWTRDHGTRRR